MNLLSSKFLSIYLLTILIVFIPFINSFSLIDDNINQFLNYTSLVICLCIFFLNRNKIISKEILIFLLITVIFLIINYLFTDYASFKWLINWLGFLVILTSTYLIFFNFNYEKLNLLNKFVKKNLFILIIFFSILNIYLIIQNYNLILNFFKNGDFNQIISLYMFDYGLYKQKFGFFMIIFLLFPFIFKNEIKKVSYFFLLLSLLLFLPIFIGIRSLLLGLSLFCILFFYSKTSSHMRFLIFLFLLLVIVLFFAFIDYKIFLTNLYEFSEPRSNLFLASLYILDLNILGIGNGGFANFVNENQFFLLNNFGSEKMIAQKTFPNSPESDLIFFISSWGILSLFFFYIILRIIIKSFNLLLNYSENITCVAKLLITSTIILFFMGISEDFNSLVVWWIFAGTSLGIIDRYENKLIKKL